MRASFSYVACECFDSFNVKPWFPVRLEVLPFFTPTVPLPEKARAPEDNGRQNALKFVEGTYVTFFRGIPLSSNSLFIFGTKLPVANI